MNVEGALPEAQVPVEERYLETVPPRPENERSFGRTRRIGKWGIKFTGMALATAAVAGLYEYQADISEVKSMLADTHPYVIENAGFPLDETNDQVVPNGVYNAMEGSERAYIAEIKADKLVTINFSGFGLTNTPRADEVLSAFNEIGANWSVHYDNLGIDVHVIAQMLVDKLKDEGTTRFGMYADSMGNIVALQVAVEMSKLNPDLTFEFMVMDSPAVGLQVLREKSVSDGYKLIDGIKALPGAEYSRYDRLVAEMYLRMNRIHDFESFKHVFAEVHREVFDNADLPGNALLAEQFRIIMGARVQDSFDYFGKKDEQKRPRIFFMGAEDEASDDVVDTNKSFKLVQAWTSEAGLPFEGKFGIKDFHHGAQWMSMKEYHEVLGVKIVPEIVAALGADDPSHLPLGTS